MAANPLYPYLGLTLMLKLKFCVISSNLKDRTDINMEFKTLDSCTNFKRKRFKNLNAFQCRQTSDFVNCNNLNNLYVVPNLKTSGVVRMHISYLFSVGTRVMLAVAD